MRNRIAVVGVVVALMSVATVAVAAHQFADVPNDHPYHDEIAWLADNGITIGYDDGTYRPGDDVSRGEMAVFFQRLVNKFGGSTGPQGATGPAGPAGADAVPNVSMYTLNAPTAIAKIGGPINDNNTDLAVGVVLEAGRYLVEVDGAFILAADASWSDATDVWPQISLWIDRSDDGKFQWREGEGSISPNALMPTVKNRHISVNGAIVIELSKPTHVGLLAHGYTSTQGSEGSGEIIVRDARLIVTPVTGS